MITVSLIYNVRYLLKFLLWLDTETMSSLNVSCFNVHCFFVDFNHLLF